MLYMLERRNGDNEMFSDRDEAMQAGEVGDVVYERSMTTRSVIHTRYEIKNRVNLPGKILRFKSQSLIKKELVA